MKEEKRVKGFVVLGVALALLVACRGGTGEWPAVANKPESVPMRQVADDLGRTMNIPVKVMRVISLAPNLTENIFAVGAGERLVGVTTFCNYPEQTEAIAKIGDTLNPNMERIVALKPDVVFVSTASQIETFSKTLTDNGIAVYVTNPDSINGVLKNLNQLGELLGTGEKADRFVTDLQRRVADISKMNSLENRVRVFVQISNEPLFTIGKHSFLTGALEEAGAESVTANVETAYPKLSKETALALSPDVIILSESDDNREPNEVFKNSPAVRNGRIISINADLLSRPGPRLVDALEQIARELHSEKFRNK